MYFDQEHNIKKVLSFEEALIELEQCYIFKSGESEAFIKELAISMH